MNINLVYEGKDYNFDIPNGVTIDYLKELSSKIFNSDKALLDLVYNNQKIDNTDDNTLIKDLIPEGETNTILTVQINKDINNNNNNKNEIIPLVSLKTKTIDKNVNNEKELKKFNENNVNKKENIKSDEIKKKIIHIMNKDKSRNKINVDNRNNNNLIKKEFDFTIFHSIFLKKNKDLFELMKEFNNKIKEIYSYLYKKYKNLGGNAHNNYSSSSNNSSISSISIGINNNYFYELSIFLKKIINFYERQINYYRHLLELIRKYDKNKDILQLNDFYANLLANNINNIIKNNEKKDTFEPIKFLKFKNLKENKIYSNKNNSLSGNNLESLNINNNNNLPLLRSKNVNSSLNLSKKNINFNLNDISSQKNNKNNSTNKQIINKEKDIEKEKEKEKLQKINNINNGVKTTKLPKNFLSFDNKLATNNNNNKNNNINNKNENNIEEKNKEKNKDKDKDKDKSDIHSSIDSENSSEKDLVDDISINEYKNKNKNNTKIAPIPLHIRNSVSTNIIPRKFSVINNSLRSNSIVNNINNGFESLEKINEDKKKQKLLRFSSSNIFTSKLKNTPNLNKKININEMSPNKTKRKGLNDSINNENELINVKKIKDIDISSMTINDSNFIRDKQKSLIKKSSNNMNKYDFFM